MTDSLKLCAEVLKKAEESIKIIISDLNIGLLGHQVDAAFDELVGI